MNNFCKQKCITKKINDKDVRFYAVPFGTILKMKSAGHTVSKLVAALLTDHSKDNAVETSTIPSEISDSKGEAYVQTHTVQKEISASLASLRHKQLADCVQGLWDEVASPEILSLVKEVIVKSASEEFSDSDMAEMEDKMDFGTMFQYLSGAIEASMEGIQGLGKFLSPQMKDKLQMVKSMAVKSQ